MQYVIWTSLSGELCPENELYLTVNPMSCPNMVLEPLRLLFFKQSRHASFPLCFIQFLPFLHHVTYACDLGAKRPLTSSPHHTDILCLFQANGPRCISSPPCFRVPWKKEEPRKKIYICVTGNQLFLFTMIPFLNFSKHLRTSLFQFRL